mmetsp:Transcript_40667/g.67969  ORF Transcript_40667/g.67969 Transcript_40667/m.67969 type:complete len:246 (-) Transcript_40667:1130-1867(-)
MLGKSKNFIEHHLLRAISKNKLTEEDKATVEKRIVHSTVMKELESTEFCIEAVTESTEVKSNVLRQLEQITKPDVILATNTSSISITKLAATLNRSSKCIGMHFFFPVPVMNLVEVITGLQTDEDTIKTTLKLSQKLGKTVTRSSDVPGFISNRLLMPYINEAILALEQNIGTVQDIDTTMKLGTGVPMGPLQLADFIGLDTCLNIMNVLHLELGEKYRPSVTLKKYVDAGYLGKKSGRGFYIYT